MAVTAIVFSSILFAASLACLAWRQIASPCLAFVGLLVISFAKSQDGNPLLPINNNIIFGWLCMTVLVTVATMLQPAAVRNTSKGIGYLTIGSVVGLAIGLLGFTFTNAVNLLYGIMIVCTAAGTFFGYLLYSNTPSGRGVALASGNFFRYFLAKGFPVALTIMQIGVVLTLIIAINKF